MPRWAEWIAGILFVAAGVAFVATLGMSAYLGGDAAHGKYEGGRYYVRVHAGDGQSPYKEVPSAALWQADRFLGGWFPLPALLPTWAGLLLLVLARRRGGPTGDPGPAGPSPG